MRVAGAQTTMDSFVIKERIGEKTKDIRSLPSVGRSVFDGYFWSSVFASSLVGVVPEGHQSVAGGVSRACGRNHRTNRNKARPEGTAEIPSNQTSNFLVPL